MSSVFFQTKRDKAGIRPAFLPHSMSVFESPDDERPFRRNVQAIKKNMNPSGIRLGSRAFIQAQDGIEELSYPKVCQIVFCGPPLLLVKTAK